MFLKSAANLQDLRFCLMISYTFQRWTNISLDISTRFGLDFHGTDSLLLVLKSLLQYAPDLERLVLFHYQSESQQAGSNSSGMVDFVVQFAFK